MLAPAKPPEAALPENARKYVEKIEALSGIRIISVGVGPDRNATIERV